MTKIQNLMLGAVALAALGVALPAAAAERQFEVINGNSSVSIQRVWTALAGDPNDAWDASGMTAPIAKNSTTTFTMPAGASCFFDVKVQFSDGVEQTFANVNICTDDRVQAN